MWTVEGRIGKKKSAETSQTNVEFSLEENILELADFLEVPAAPVTVGVYDDEYYYDEDDENYEDDSTSSIDEIPTTSTAHASVSSRQHVATTRTEFVIDEDAVGLRKMITKILNFHRIGNWQKFND
jgi:hypothetical protein